MLPCMDVGFNFFVDLYQMVEFINTVWIYCTDMSATKLLQRIFLSSVLLSEHWNSIFALKLPCIVVVFQLGCCAGVFQVLRFWRLSISHLLLYFGTLFCKSILNKSVCKFNRMDNNFSLLCKTYIDNFSWNILPSKYLNSFYFFSPQHWV